MQDGDGLYLSKSWEKLTTMPECLSYCFNHCSGSEKYFYKERSANAEGTRAHYDFCYCHVFFTWHFFFFLMWSCCFPSTYRHSPWLNQWPMSPMRNNTDLYGNVVALLWVLLRALGDRMQTASLGWDFPCTKFPCISLVLQSVITLYWLGM